MKRLSLFIALLVLNGSAFAMGGNTNSKAQSGAITGPVDSESKSGAIAVIQLGDTTSNVRGADLGKMVPNVMAPSLTTTLTETCMGSTSFGGSGSGFGFSFGTTWRDSACVRRLDARQLAAFNDMGTAREIMCASSIVREAAQRAGRPCVEDGGLPAYQLAQPAPVAAVTVEDAAAVKVVDDVAKSNQIIDDGSPIYRVETPTK